MNKTPIALPRSVATRAASETVKSEASSNERNPAAVALGRLGGLKGGKARAATLTAEQRREIARSAAKARWRNSKNEQSE